MAGGPLGPAWTDPDASGNAFPNIYVGGGAGIFTQAGPGMGVAASIGSNVNWYLGFDMPPAIPTGTMKLAVRGLANATAGSALITPITASVPPGGDPSAAPGFSETQQTLTWVSSGSEVAFTATGVTVGASGGTGYAVGDQITCAGGTASPNAVLRVSSVTAGVVTGLQVVMQGIYSVKPTLGAVTQGSTTGSGTGALATLTFDSAGSADHYQEFKLAVTPPPVVDGVYLVQLQFNSASWTLAAVSTWFARLLWE
jgi:hypothetical protein